MILTRGDVRGREWVRLPGGRWAPVIAGGGGGGKTTTVVQTNVPPKSQEEIELLREQLSATRTQNELFRMQIEEVRKQNEEFANLLPAQRELFMAQTSALTGLARLQEQSFDLASRQMELLETAFTETPEQQRIRELSEERTIAFLEGRPPTLSAEQTQRLDTLFGTQREEGQEEIRRFAEEIAGQRGLKLSDTPVGGEAIRAGERLERGLRGARAAAELDLTQAETIFSEQTRQFQEGLRQQAFMNRLALVGATPQGSGLLASRAALPVSSVGGILGPADSTGLLNVLTQERIASAPVKTTQSYRPGFFDYYSATLQGLGAAAGAFAASSVTLKKDILPLDEAEFDRAGVLDMTREPDEYERARKTVKGLPIARWRYKWEPATRTSHIGPLAETLPDEVREGPLHVNLLDLAGLTLAAVKGIDRRVDRLEQRGLPVEVA